MSNRIKNGINPRAPEIGKIKIGRKASGNPKKGQNGKTWYPPEKLDHFIVTKPSRDNRKINYVEDVEVMNYLRADYRKRNPKFSGKDEEIKITEIPIILPFDDQTMVFQSWFAFYKGNHLVCRGDGETANMLFFKDGKPGAYTLIDTDKNGDAVTAGERRMIVCDHIGCPNRQPDKYGNIPCNPNGRLICIIPASKRLNGYFFLRTKSLNTISRITYSLEQMKEQADGILKGIPAKLFFTEKATQDHGNVQVVDIDWDFDEIQAMRKAVIDERQYRLDYDVNIKQLEDKARASGILEDNDDPEDIIGEFYPEQTEEYREAKKAEESSVIARADNVLGDVEDVVPEKPEEEEDPPEDDGEAAEKKEKDGDETVPSLF
jgi:hypothetical protein